MVSSQDTNDKEKELAKESQKTLKAREKLRKRLEMMDAKITKEALEQKSIEIHRWISRHADNRIALKDKTIALFDENENAAVLSEKIAKLAEQIQLDHSE